jgi:hypothetical protein
MTEAGGRMPEAADVGGRKSEVVAIKPRIISHAKDTEGATAKVAYSS